MRIGIIGTGNIGGTLTRRLAALGHDVAIANSRGPQSLEALAGETGATAAEPATAAQDADLVIVAVPLEAVPDLPAGSSSTRATTTRAATVRSLRSRPAPPRAGGSQTSSGAPRS